MSKQHLILPDLDDAIIAHLDPPSVLAMVRVNRHYNQLLKDKQSQFNKVQMSFETACISGYYWIAKWIYDIHKRDEFLMRSLINQSYAYRYAEKGCGSIYAAKDEIFSRLCFNGSITCATLFLQLEKYFGKIDIHANNEEIFRWSCLKGHNETAKWLISLENTHGKIGIHANNECAFRLACDYGHKETAKWLILLENTHGKIDIHAKNEYAFRLACQRGHKETAEWLISLENTHGKINIHVLNESAFRSACKNGHKETAEWLISLENTHGKIDIHAYNEYAFRFACRNDYQYLTIRDLDTLIFSHIDILSVLTMSGVNKHYLEFTNRTQRRLLINTAQDNFCAALEHGLFELAERSIQTQPFYPGYFMAAFLHACEHDQIDVAEWILARSESYGKKIDVHDEIGLPLYCSERVCTSQLVASHKDPQLN